MKNIKTILTPKKGVEEVIFFMPLLSDSNFIPDDRSYSVKEDFLKHVKKTIPSLTVNSITFHPVTVEDSDDYENRWQDRGWVHYEYDENHNYEPVIENPIVIRGQNLPELKFITRLFPYDENIKLIPVSYFSDTNLSDGQAKMLKEQIAPQILEQVDFDELLKTLKEQAIEKAKQRTISYVQKKHKEIKELQYALDNIHSIAKVGQF